MSFPFTQVFPGLWLFKTGNTGLEFVWTPYAGGLDVTTDTEAEAFAAARVKMYQELAGLGFQYVRDVTLTNSVPWDPGTGLSVWTFGGEYGEWQ